MRFLNGTLAINGTTIIDINPINKTFSYIEDDFLNRNGHPIVIDYPSVPSDFNTGDLGKRLLILYDHSGSFQLMRINPYERMLSMPEREQYAQNYITKLRQMPERYSLYAV